MKRVVLVFFLLFLFQKANSQYTEIINSKRPGFSESPYSIGSNVYQIESGFFYSKSDNTDFRANPKTYGGTAFLRIGKFSEKFEINAKIDYTFKEANTKNFVAHMDPLYEFGNTVPVVLNDKTGIVQGGLIKELRSECMQRLEEMNFPGLALGGLSVGEKNDEMREFLEDFVHTMPAHKPRYLMGVGKPLDVLHGIKQGLDMFDCVLPTRNARNGQFLTHAGPLNIKKERFKEDKLPPDPDCSCRVCKRYSRAYVRHLFTVGEYAAGQMISYHNLFFYLQMTRDARNAILQDQFDEFYENFYKKYSSNLWV